MLVGVKHQKQFSELTLELPAEQTSRSLRTPTLQGTDVTAFKRACIT